MAQSRRSAWWAWLWVVVAVGGVAAGGWYAVRYGFAGQPAVRAAEQASPPEPPAEGVVHVDTVRPRVGDMDRTTTQPGTVQSY